MKRKARTYGGIQRPAYFRIRPEDGHDGIDAIRAILFQNAQAHSRYRDLPFLQRMPVLVVRPFHITPNPAIRDNQPFKLPKPHLPFTLSLIIARVIRGVNTILLRYETTTDNTDLLQGRTPFARPACWFVIYHFLCIPTTGYWYLGSIVP